VKSFLAFLALVGTGAVCFALGHKQGQRVPFLGGMRCPACGKALDAEYVDPNRKQGPRSPARIEAAAEVGKDPRYYRSGQTWRLHRRRAS